jgi:hypothetical protein
MSHPNATLGLSCPSGGQFYVCDTSTIRFIGCCTSDPCSDGSGNCPTANMRTSSFSADHYGDIKAQSCVDANPAVYWYTCQEAPPFLGCCKGDPCSAKKCNQSSLIAARLSDDESLAQVFIGTYPTSSSTSSSTSSTASASDSQSGSHLSTGAIIGIAVGCASVVLILLAILGYKCWATRRQARLDATKPLSPTSFPYSRKFGDMA